MNEFALISMSTKDMYGEVPNVTHLSALTQNIPTYFKRQFYKLSFCQIELGIDESRLHVLEKITVFSILLHSGRWNCVSLFEFLGRHTWPILG